MPEIKLDASGRLQELKLAQVLVRNPYDEEEVISAIAVLDSAHYQRLMKSVDRITPRSETKANAAELAAALPGGSVTQHYRDSLTQTLHAIADAHEQRGQDARVIDNYRVRRGFVITSIVGSAAMVLGTASHCWPCAIIGALVACPTASVAGTHYYFAKARPERIERQADASAKKFHEVADALRAQPAVELMRR